MHPYVFDTQPREHTVRLRLIPMASQGLTIQPVLFLCPTIAIIWKPKIKKFFFSTSIGQFANNASVDKVREGETERERDRSKWDTGNQKRKTMSKKKAKVKNISVSLLQKSRSPTKHETKKINKNKKRQKQKKRRLRRRRRYDEKRHPNRSAFPVLLVALL